MASTRTSMLSWACTGLVALLLLQGAAGSVQTPAVSAGDDEVKSLPGLEGQPPSKIRSGYITVDGDRGRRLFYAVVDSEGDPRVDPLVLWLTGGPGCSSMDAFVYEHGPFVFSFGDATAASGGSEKEQEEQLSSERAIVLRPNPYSWSKAATMVYVDSPAGAGMSYSESPDSDYDTNDERTIADLLRFLLGLLARYPELAALDLYIAGESYGGVYVPLLARKILQYNDGVSSSPLRLKGYITGNGVTDDEAEAHGQVDFAFGLGLIEPPLAERIHRLCASGYWNATDGSACRNAYLDMKDVLWDINPYDIMQPCNQHNSGNHKHSSRHGRTWPRDGSRSGVEDVSGRDVSGGAAEASTTSQRRSRSSRRQQRRLRHSTQHSTQAGVQHSVQQREAPQERTGRLSASNFKFLARRPLGHTVQCGDRSIALDWFNRPAVRAALHAAPHEVVGRWEPCSDVLYYDVDEPIAIAHMHEELVVERGLRALLYSGDHDMVVPLHGMRRWLYSLPTLKPGTSRQDRYAAWNIEGQVAGFRDHFAPGSLTFATVKGAGHMVPSSKPREALVLFSRFLNGTL